MKNIIKIIFLVMLAILIPLQSYSIACEATDHEYTFIYWPQQPNPNPIYYLDSNVWFDSPGCEIESVGEPLVGDLWESEYVPGLYLYSQGFGGVHTEDQFTYTITDGTVTATATVYLHVLFIPFWDLPIVSKNAPNTVREPY